ncbi:centromere protein H isoform X1 [Heliangelus exortis]|uniref:centromere protein H isoform X1 n=1 Tax=Heliangelus exortis TaxID=472823 RepID=UPI003A8CB3BC
MEALPGEPEKAVRKVDVLMLLRLRDQMKQQLRECSAAADTNQESDLDHVIEEGRYVKNTTKDMEKDIEEKKVSFQNKTLALQRIQIMLALRNKLKQNDSDSREILKMLKHIVILSQEVTERQQQLREKEQKLTDIKMKRLSLKKTQQQKMLQIQIMTEKQTEEQKKIKMSEELEEKRNRLKKEQELITIIQNIFQSIIIGSRVNWAEDPSLRAIVLKLEKNVFL